MSYWICGTMFDGEAKNDGLNKFILRGYWYCHDPIDDTPGQPFRPWVQRMRVAFRAIATGDIIVVKKIHSIRRQKMEIRAIGTVKDVDFNAWRIYVDWKPIGPNNSYIVSIITNLHGMVRSLHGPFNANDPQVQGTGIMYL